MTRRARNAGAYDEPVEAVTDEELAALALAADPDAVVDADAVCFWDLAGGGPVDTLPAWYMPSPMGSRRLVGWRSRLARMTVGLVVASFVAINAAGLCNTYGQLHL